MKRTERIIEKYTELTNRLNELLDLYKSADNEGERDYVREQFLLAYERRKGFIEAINTLDQIQLAGGIGKAEQFLSELSGVYLYKWARATFHGQSL